MTFPYLYRKTLAQTTFSNARIRASFFIAALAAAAPTTMHGATKTVIDANIVETGAIYSTTGSLPALQIQAENVATSYTGNNVTLSTTRANTYGVNMISYNSTLAATLALNGGTITTGGNSAYGLATFYSNATLNGTAVKTAGAYAVGIYAFGASYQPTVITLNNADVQTTNLTNFSDLTINGHALWARSYSTIIVAGTTTLHAAERTSGNTYDAFVDAGGVIEFLNNEQTGRRLAAGAAFGRSGTLKFSGTSNAPGAFVDLEKSGILDVSASARAGGITVSSVLAKGQNTINLGLTTMIADGALAGTENRALDLTETTVKVSIKDSETFGSIRLSDTSFLASTLTLDIQVDAGYTARLGDAFALVQGEPGSVSASSVVYLVNGHAFTPTEDYSVHIGGGDFRVLVTAGMIGLVSAAAPVPEPSTYAFVAGAGALVLFSDMRRRRRQ